MEDMNLNQELDIMEVAEEYIPVATSGSNKLHMVLAAAGAVSALSGVAYAMYRWWKAKKNNQIILDVTEVTGEEEDDIE